MAKNKPRKGTSAANDQAATAASGLSAIVAQTPKAIAERSGASLSAVQDALKQLEAKGLVERRGSYYRVDNSIPWFEAREPLPSVTVAHSVSYGQNSYVISFPPPRPVAKPAVKPRPDAQESLFV